MPRRNVTECRKNFEIVCNYLPAIYHVFQPIINWFFSAEFWTLLYKAQMIFSLALLQGTSIILILALVKLR